MAFTYSSDPAASDRDYVRFRVGDTDSTDQQLADAEVDAMLAEKGNKLTAAAFCARAIAAKYARLVTQAVGDLRMDYSDLAKQYNELAQQLSSEASIAVATPYAGGISIADKESAEDDSDRVAPAFAVGMHDNPQGVREELGED